MSARSRAPDNVIRPMANCYRHPDRETGVSCSNCDRPICTDCMTTTSVGMRCPECSRQRTEVHSIQSARPAASLTTVLIGISVAAYIGELLGGAGAGSAGGSSLTAEGGLGGPFVADGQWYRLVTSGFLHAGLAHLAFNMFALWILGGLLEPAIGRLRFGVVYFASLLAGSFGALLVAPDSLTVGASGAVFGLMGAAFVVMRNRGVNPMESGLGLWIGLNLLITFAVPNISIGGHIGGLVGGVVAALLLFELPERARVPARAPLLLASAVGVVAVVGSIVIA